MEVGPNNVPAGGQGLALSDSHDFVCASNTALTQGNIYIPDHQQTEPRVEAVSYSFPDRVLLSVNISCVNE